jgi:hypothetical protein
MADQTPPPGYGGQEPPSYPGGPPNYPGGPPNYPSYPGGPGGYGPPQPGYGYGGYPGPQNPQSSTPTVLSVIGIVCWFLCSPAAIVLGLVAQSKFRAQGRSDTLAKVAWIGGIVLLALGILLFIVTKGKG